MALTVRLFSVLKANYGEKVELQVHLPASISEIKSLLQSMAIWVPGSRIAVNHSFANDSENVNDGDEVAVIPPVSGG